MAVTTIIDNGASLKITIGSQIRNVTKNQIVEVTVIKTNIIKIDIGQGALYNIFIPYVDVTNPVTANAAALRDKINDFMASAAGGSAVGSATEANQVVEIDLLSNINNSMASLNNVVAVIDSKIFYEPRLVDDSGAGIVYKGYSLVDDAAQSSPIWAIQRIRKEAGDVQVTTWANGNKNFDNSWIDREVFTYS